MTSFYQPNRKKTSKQNVENWILIDLSEAGKIDLNSQFILAFNVNTFFELYTKEDSR